MDYLSNLNPATVAYATDRLARMPSGRPYIDAAGGNRRFALYLHMVDRELAPQGLTHRNVAANWAADFVAGTSPRAAAQAVLAPAP